MLAADAGILVFCLLLYRGPEVEDGLCFCHLRNAGDDSRRRQSGLRGLRILRSHLFCLAGQFKSAIWFLLGLVVAVGVVMVLSPALASYITSYLGTDQAGTVTGRSDVWAAGWQLIKQRMLLGRGFMSSRFLGLQDQRVLAARHLHNGFLEVLYNNGLVGLFVMVMMHVMIIRNLFLVMRKVSAPYGSRMLRGLSEYFD